MRKRTGQLKHTIRFPKQARLQEIEDFYFFYVLQIGIPERLFWDEDIVFVHRVVDDKTAYDNYVTYKRQER